MSTINNKPIIISLEGNIGSGKSTMLKYIKELYPHWNYIDEPVDSWLSMKDENGSSLLECFYHDKKRWSYTFQNSAFITRYTSMMNTIQNWYSNPDPNKSNIFITERCVLTDRYVFAEMLREEGDLNLLEWNLYTKWFDWFSNSAPINGLIYIDTEYKICDDRIKWRGRKGEESIPVQYLDSLEKQHNKWLSNCNIPILRITSDKSQIKQIHDWVTKTNN
jgi:deoxyadenosine/deoxycytidine kinase